MALGEGAVSYERGVPVFEGVLLCVARNHGKNIADQIRS